MKLYFSLGLVFSLALSVLPSIVYSQESPITVSVNNTHFSTDELVILTVVVRDDSPQQPRPILPRLNGLTVIDMDMSTDVSVVNGKIHTQVTYTYSLQPRRTGLLTIPPVTVKIDDEIFQAAPISINVSQGAPPVPSAGNAVRPVEISPPAELKGQDFFIESAVDISNPYVDQQVIYTFRFYQAIQLHRKPEYNEPLFVGFETTGLPVQEYNFEIEERTYLITEIRTALFPQTSGNITIGPARLMFPGNIYEEPIELYTEPITVKVQPLPENAPPDFGGAVGQYEIEAWFSPQVAVINQPSSFYVAVSGIGNIQALPEPIWPELGEWRTYDSLSSLTTETTEDGQTAGTRVYERLMVADQIGDLTIPGAKLVYFDPMAGKYVTIMSMPLKVKVIPAPTPEPTNPGAMPTVIGAVPVEATPPASPDQIVNPILLDSPRSDLQLIFPIFVALLIGLCGAIPLAAAIGAGGVWWWQQRQLRATQQVGNPEELRQPNQKIHPALARAMRANNDNYRTVSLALTDYLSQALQTPVKSLTRQELVRQLRRSGLDEALIGRISDTLAQSDLGRYGPSPQDAGWALMATTEALLGELDKVFDKKEKRPGSET